MEHSPLGLSSEDQVAEPLHIMVSMRRVWTGVTGGGGKSQAATRTARGIGGGGIGREDRGFKLTVIGRQKQRRLNSKYL